MVAIFVYISTVTFWLHIVATRWWRRFNFWHPYLRFRLFSYSGGFQETLILLSMWFHAYYRQYIYGRTVLPFKIFWHKYHNILWVFRCMCIHSRFWTKRMTALFSFWWPFLFFNIVSVKQSLYITINPIKVCSCILY